MRFTHLRDDFGNMFATVATDGTGYGVALCSGTDQFSRKTGRNIASNRLKNGYEVIPDSPLEICYKGTYLFATDLVRSFVSKVVLKRIDDPFEF